MIYKKFAILGGDKRNICLGKLLEEEGHIVSRYGFDNYDLEVISEANNLYEAVDGADYIIGPLPCSNNGTDLNAVYSGKPITIDDTFRLIKQKQIFFAGHIKEQTLESAAKYNVNCVDILQREELALLNAVPTAEGAIKIAIDNTDFTLHDSRVMVIGYGRIGKVLSKMLSGIGAHVFPVVKERYDAALARSNGYSPIMSDQMDGRLGQMNIIFNTVPQIILDRKNIKYVNKDCLLIDLSSPPHGIDSGFAKDAGLNVLFTGSLPGVVAPRTAAKYIKETVYNMINEIENADKE